MVDALGLPIVAGFLADARAGVAPRVHLARLQHPRDLPAGGLLEGLVELGHRDMQGEHLGEEQRHRVVARITAPMLQEHPVGIALPQRLGHQSPGGRHQGLVVQHPPAGPECLGRDEHPVHRLAALGQDGRLAGCEEIAGAPELRFEDPEAFPEMGLMRRLTDHQNGPSQFLQEEIRGLHSRGPRRRTPSVRPLRRGESAIFALVLERHLDAFPSPVGPGEVASHHSGDDRTATAPLRPGLDPSPLTPIPAGQPLFIRQVVAAQLVEPPRGEGTQHLVFTELRQGLCGQKSCGIPVEPSECHPPAGDAEKEPEHPNAREVQSHGIREWKIRGVFFSGWRGRTQGAFDHSVHSRSIWSGSGGPSATRIRYRIR